MIYSPHIMTHPPVEAECVMDHRDFTGMSEPHTPEEEGRMVEDTDVRDGGVSIKTQATRNHLSIHV